MFEEVDSIDGIKSVEDLMRRETNRKVRHWVGCCSCLKFNLFFWMLIVFPDSWGTKQKSIHYNWNYLLSHHQSDLIFSSTSLFIPLSNVASFKTKSKRSLLKKFDETTRHQKSTTTKTHFSSFVVMNNIIFLMFWI